MLLVAHLLFPESPVVVLSLHRKKKKKKRTNGPFEMMAETLSTRRGDVGRQMFVDVGASLSDGPAEFFGTPSKSDCEELGRPLDEC